METSIILFVHVVRSEQKVGATLICLEPTAEQVMIPVNLL